MGGSLLGGPRDALGVRAVAALLSGVRLSLPLARPPPLPRPAAASPPRLLLRASTYCACRVQRGLLAGRVGRGPEAASPGPKEARPWPSAVGGQRGGGQRPPLSQVGLRLQRGPRFAAVRVLLRLELLP